MCAKRDGASTVRQWTRASTSEARLAGDRIVVTGAVRGIGRSLGLALLAEEAHVFAVDRDDAAVASLYVAAPPSIDLLHNAGVDGCRQKISDLPAEDWRTTMAINVGSLSLALKYSAVSTPGGIAMVNTSSMLGFVASREPVESVVSKRRSCRSHARCRDQVAPAVYQGELHLSPTCRHDGHGTGGRYDEA